jgi:hypothetical protein
MVPLHRKLLFIKKNKVKNLQTSNKPQRIINQQINSAIFGFKIFPFIFGYNPHPPSYFLGFELHKILYAKVLLNVYGLQNEVYK